VSLSAAAVDLDPAFLTDEPRGLGCSLLILPPLAILIFGAVLLGLSLQRPPVGASQEDAGRQKLAVSRIFTPEIQYWSGSIEQWSQAAAVDANLVAVVMQIESCGDPSALSSAGALGLFQVMPYHFMTSENPFSPDTNATRGLEYLKRSLAAADGDAGLALAGYNGGIGLIATPKWEWPAETQRYSYWGTGIYADASNGASDSPSLAEWLAAGGETLCQTAKQRLELDN
jgi:hypothetical protein